MDEITWVVRDLRDQVWTVDVTVRATGQMGGQVMVERYRDGWCRAVAWGVWQPYGQAYEQDTKQGEALPLAVPRRGRLHLAMLDAILGRIADLVRQECHTPERDRARYTAERKAWQAQLDALAEGTLMIAVLESGERYHWREVERLDPVGLEMRIDEVRREELARRQAAQGGEP